MKQRTVRELVYQLGNRKIYPFASATVTVLSFFFYVLLIVHLSVILVINQINAQNLVL